MPSSLMYLFNRVVCLQNKQFVFQSSFSQLMDILIKPIALLCACVCMCEPTVCSSVSNWELTRRKEIIYFHVSPPIAKTDCFANKSYSINDVCINIALFGWVSLWNITHETIFPLITIIWQHTPTHMHIQTHMHAQSHKWDVTVFF